MNARTKKTFIFVFLTLFIDLLAFTLILPLLPKILDYYVTNDKSGIYKLFNENVEQVKKILRIPDSNNQVLLAGLLGSWFSMLQFISSPFFGAISDRFGRKPILILVISGSVFSHAIWSIAADSFALFVLSRTIGGLCKANISLTLAIVSDVSDEKSRGKGMALVGSSFAMAFIFGPLIGAYLSNLAADGQLQKQLIYNPSLIATLLTLIDLFIIITFLDETNTKTKDSKISKTNKSIHSHGLKSNISNAFHYVNPRSLLNFNLVNQATRKEKLILNKSGFIYFYYLLFYSGLEFTLSFLTHIRFGFSSMDQGKLYLFSGLLMFSIQGFYIRRVQGGRESLMAILGLSVIIPSFVIMGLSTTVGQIYFSLAMYSFSSAIVVPCLTTIVSSHSPQNEKGVVMGTFRSIGYLARAFGPCIASFMFWTFGSTVSYVAGALALSIPLYMMRELHINLKEEKASLVTGQSKNLAKAS